MSVKIVTFCGSLRTGSVNAAVMRAAIANAPEGVEFQVVDVSDVPLYNGDTEEAQVPASVMALHEMVAAADGLLIFSPEYNGSFPAVTKNVVDWLTRPPTSWKNRGVSLVTTTPGARAGESFRGHFDTIMGYLGVRAYPSHGIGTYGDKLDANGELVDADAIAALVEFVTDFAEVCQAEEERD